MIVFKTVLKILNKLKGMIILYTIMLISITTLNQTTGGNITNFEEVKSDILIINKDNNIITDGIVNYLTFHSNIKDIDIKNEDKVNDALFYRDVNFIIYIPKNFGIDLINDKNPIIEYKSSGDEYSSYSKMLIEKYIKTILIYKDYYSNEELIDKVNNTLENQTKILLDTQLDTSKLSSMNRYFNFLNYAFLAGCVYCISMILASLKEENVRNRTIISGYNYKKYNRIVLLSNAIITISMWILYMMLGFILFKDLMISFNGLAYAINSFVFSICSLTIGFLIGNITQNKSAIGGIINIVAIGTSFLCGCFVPLEYMPEYVVKMAHVLPTYYYVANNNSIAAMENFNINTLTPLFINVGIVIAFSLLFIIITNYISKKKQTIN